jgi:transposase-like protein
MECKFCGSDDTIRKGQIGNKPYLECKNCGHRFIDNGNFPKMRTKNQVIVVALNMYFEGLSVRKVERQLRMIYGIKVSYVTIWKWVMKYSDLTRSFVSSLTPKLSGKYHEDETAIRCEGDFKWFWQVIDEETRFIVATHLSEERDIKETITLFQKTLKSAGKKPQVMFFDGSHAYRRAFNRVFYSRYKADRVQFVRRVGIKARETNNIVERLHGTLKDRLRPMRGLKSKEKSQTLLDGFVTHYNFVRPHQSLRNRTPAEIAGLGETNWESLIVKSYKHQNSPARGTS